LGWGKKIYDSFRIAILNKNYLTAEATEDTEEEKREMNNFDTNGFEIVHKSKI
jgi:hypothetical protein